jgi:hypothetical protein
VFLVRRSWAALFLPLWQTTGLTNDRAGRREGWQTRGIQSGQKKARLTALPFLQLLSQALLVPTLPKLGFLAPINNKMLRTKMSIVDQKIYDFYR